MTYFVESEYAKLHGNRRAADVLKNTTEAKITVDRETILKINKLLSELKPQLSVNQMVIAVSQVLPVHLVPRETKDPRDEGETKETKVL